MHTLVSLSLYIYCCSTLLASSVWTVRRTSCVLVKTSKASLMDPDQEIADNLFNIVSIYKSGRVERLEGDDVVPPSVDADAGVSSKDVVIEQDTGVSARLFLPNHVLSDSYQGEKLPILVYFHGGAFCTFSPFSSRYSGYVGSLAAKAGALAVSVHYRLAPEHQLPTAYHDSLAALRWVTSHAGGEGEEPWLTQHGDLGRLIIAGDSAGGNIVHHLAIMSGMGALYNGVTIKGAAVVHPYFWGAEPLALETRNEETRRKMELLWRLVCRDTPGLDADTLINPLAEGAMDLRGLACERLLVVVAEKDVLRERGREYYEAVKESGWRGEAELFETDGESHVFHLVHPSTDKALALMERMASFINQQGI